MSRPIDMPMQLALRLSTGVHAGQVLPILKPETRLGSDPQMNDIALSDPSLQPEHARIILDSNRYIIQRRDAQSLLMVNFQEVEYAILQDGDQVTLGQPGLSFVVQLTPAVAPQQPPLYTQTGPQFAYEGVAPQQQMAAAQPSIPIAPIAVPVAPVQMAQMQMAQPQTPLQVAHTETTRYLCAAAHLDENFHRYVLSRIVGEEHRALGEAYGVDIIPVLKVAYAARQRTFIRDCILFAILVLGIGFLIYSIGLPLFGLFHLANASTTPSTYPGANPYPGTSSPFGNINPLAILSTALLASLSILAFFLLFSYALFILIISAITRLFGLRIRAGATFLLVFLVFCWYAIPFFLLAWLTVAIERMIRYFGADTARLTKNAFHPANLPYPLDPQVEQKARAVFQPQDGNVVVYSGYSPFAGAGISVGGWSFAVDMTKGKREAGTTLKPKTFQVDDIYTYVTDALKDLDLEGKSDLCGTVAFEDKLYVNGQEIRNDMRFLHDPFARPYNQVNEHLLEQFKLNPTQDIRFYKCVRLTSWRGEVVLTIFYRFIMIANSLYTEVDYLLLPPLKESYYQINTIEPTLSVYKVWDSIKRSFLPTAGLWLHSPISVFNVVFAGWLGRQRNNRIERSIKDNPAFDYGTSTSLREVASTDEYRRYFQYLDKEMYVKIIERQFLESIVEFLDVRNIDTSDLKRRQETILNNGVIVSGGAFTAGNLAVGAQAKASTSTFGGSTPENPPAAFAAPANP